MITDTQSGVKLLYVVKISKAPHISELLLDSYMVAEDTVDRLEKRGISASIENHVSAVYLTPEAAEEAAVFTFNHLK